MVFESEAQSMVTSSSSLAILLGLALIGHTTMVAVRP
jgi:hypothetical protein